MLDVYVVNIKEIRGSSPLSILMSNKYKEDIHKNQSLKAWFLLENILNKKYNIVVNKDDIYFNDHGKPYIKNNLIYFNISHSNEYVCVAISDSEVGVDIEKIIVDDNKITKFFKKLVSKENVNNFNKDKGLYITSIWTKLEAYTKYKGVNFDFEFINNMDEKFINIHEIDGYCVSAVNENNEKCSIIKK